MKNSLLFVFMFAMLFANAQQQTFSKVYYNGVDNIQAYDLMRSADNHYFIAGTGFITKTDSAGNIDWTKNYYTGMQNKFNCIIPDPDGNPVVAGYSNDGDAMIMKIDQNGDTLWARNIDFGSFSEAFTVSQVHDSGFVLCGYVYASSLPNEMFVARIDQDGNLIWSKTYSVGNHQNYAYSVKETADSGFIVAAYADNYPPYEPLAVAMKLNSEGLELWCKGFSGGSGSNSASDVVIDGTDLIFGFEINSLYALVKTDSAGNVMWSMNQNFSMNNFLNVTHTRLRKTICNKLVSVSSSEVAFSAYLVVCDSAGNQLSANNVYMYGSSAIEAEDSGFMILGNGPMMGVKSDMKNILESQFVLVKTDSSGNSAMCNDYYFSSSSPLTLSPIPLVAASNTAGTINGLSFMISDLTLNIANECVGFIGGFDDSEIGSFSIYPNPSNGAFTLQFVNSTVNKECLIEVYNPLGVCVYNASETIRNEIFLDLKELNSGLYYVVVSAEGESMSRVVEIHH